MANILTSSLYYVLDIYTHWMCMQGWEPVWEGGNPQINHDLAPGQVLKLKLCGVNYNIKKSM